MTKLVGFLVLVMPSMAETYYVRTTGGTADQCTGLVDAPYPGSGTGRACAWAHPYWALTNRGTWRTVGGDTLILANGSYMIGYGAPNTTWCNPERSYECGLPALPSGPSPERPTRLLGAGSEKGCFAAPELWGNEGARPMLSLARTTNVVIACFEITDHSACIRSHPDPSTKCPTQYPFGPFGFTGIYAADSVNVTLRDLNIHGLAHTGIQAGRIRDWLVEDVRIAANARVGWDGDLDPDSNSSNSGTLTFRRFKVEWNGCGETYPTGQYQHCWAQLAGGYGDGLGTARTSGRWVFEDSEFSHNTSDGLDLLYLETVNGERPSVEIHRTIARGNAGNQIKISGDSQIVNSLIAGDCAFFLGKPFASLMGDLKGPDHCRALGSALLLSINRGDSVKVINSTLVGQGDGIMSSECITHNVPAAPACAGTEKVMLLNNIFVGYGDIRGGDDAALIWDPDGFATFEYNLIYNVKDPPCDRGNNICAEPMFRTAALDWLDARLRAASPAVDSKRRMYPFPATT